MKERMPQTDGLPAALALVLHLEAPPQGVLAFGEKRRYLAATPPLAEERQAVADEAAPHSVLVPQSGLDQVLWPLRLAAEAEAAGGLDLLMSCCPTRRSCQWRWQGAAPASPF
mmetsp:Transcript_55637/g.120158  ORF Transcript_55637/g.120158 Transcript_55637/m.120158 type:complete len:113 (+) Transcript_55637:412-750(+)